MRSTWLAATLMTVLAGCQGGLAEEPGKGTTTTDPMAPCTDPNKCCPQETMKCVGDPDGKIICTCSDLWDCSKNPRKCEQDLPVPPGGGDWSCTWTEFKYTCTKSGDKDKNPEELSGGGDWSCTWSEKEFKWTCTTTPPNPTNKPEGAGTWKCTVTEDKLVCDRTDSQTAPTGGGVWKCTTDKEGKTTCEKQDENKGLPPGGGNWKCHETSVNGVATWVCVGTSDTPPGGGGWTCVEVSSEFNTWKCEKPEGSTDTPPGGGWYSCVKGSEFNGTVCEKVSGPPTPPTPTGTSECIVGEKMWCDGLQYCGWGQVKCDPATKKWKTIKDSKGNVILDCQELSTGERPNTVCACYHFYFNPACCERPDCIVPSGTNGQLCPASPGKLCDYCSPQKPNCVEQGARCVVTNSHETFCGRLCDPVNKPCPTGFNCLAMKLQVGSTYQCVPADFSCYY